MEPRLDQRHLLEQQVQDITKETGGYRQHEWLDGTALQIDPGSFDSVMMEYILVQDIVPFLPGQQGSDCCIPGTVPPGQQGSDRCTPGTVLQGQQGSDCGIPREVPPIPGREQRQELLFFRQGGAFKLTSAKLPLAHVGSNSGRRHIAHQHGSRREPAFFAACQHRPPEYGACGQSVIAAWQFWSVRGPHSCPWHPRPGCRFHARASLEMAPASPCQGSFPVWGSNGAQDTDVSGGGSCYTAAALVAMSAGVNMMATRRRRTRESTNST